MACRSVRMLTVLLLLFVSTGQGAYVTEPDVGPLFYQWFNPEVSTPEGGVYACPDTTFTSSAINDFREAYGLKPLVWDDQLVVEAKSSLLDNPASCTDTDLILAFSMNTTSFPLAYLAKNRASPYKCVQAVNFWYYLGSTLADSKNFRDGFKLDVPSTNMTRFAALMWESAASVGCALKDCDPTTHLAYAVVCHIGELAEFSDGEVKADEITNNVPTKPDGAKLCPQMIITTPQLTLENTTDMAQELNTTVERLVCYHEQFSNTDVNQSGVPIAIPCADVVVPSTCDSLATMVPLSSERGNCPANFIANPRTRTFDDIAEEYNKAGIPEELKLTGQDLCCTNSAYINPDYEYCGPIAPLQNGNVVIPCPESMQYRNCRNESMPLGVAESKGVFKCPDPQATVDGRNELRATLGLPPVRWNKTFEDALYEGVLKNIDGICPPYAPILYDETDLGWKDDYIWLVGTMSGPMVTPRCSNVAVNADLQAQNLGQFIKAVVMPDKFRDQVNSAAKFLYLHFSDNSKSFACVMVSCHAYYVSVTCLYDMKREEAYENLDWLENIPQYTRITSCPTPYWPLPGETYEDIAAKHDITLQELMCWRDQVPTATNQQVNWAYGIPLAIPCKSRRPNQVTCEAYQLLTGECGVEYTVKPGDSFANIVTFNSSKRQKLTACELCVANKKYPNCSLSMMEKVNIPCRSDITEYMMLDCEDEYDFSNSYSTSLGLQLTDSMSKFTVDIYNAISGTLRDISLGSESGLVKITSPAVGTEFSPNSRRRGLLQKQTLQVNATIQSSDITKEEMSSNLEKAAQNGSLVEVFLQQGVPVSEVRLPGGITSQLPTSPSPLPPSPLSAPPPPPPPSDGGLSAGAIAGIVVGCIAVFAIVVAIVALFVMKKTKKKKPHQSAVDSAVTNALKESTKSSISAVLTGDRSTGGLHAGRGNAPPLESMYLSEWIASLATSAPESTRASSETCGARSYVIDADALVFEKDSGGRLLQLGRGAFSKVYRAKLQDKDVAVKVMEHSAQQEGHIKQMLREIATLWQCNHESIVEFFGASFAGSNVMMVFELMPQGDLFHALRSHAAAEYTWKNRGYQLAVSIAKGMAYMHGHDPCIIHCDLKSPNILLSCSGQAKIGDMGMSKFLTKEYVTKGAEVGSFAWAAPELLLDSRITEKVDIFSFGVILWELVTGELPQRGHNRKPRVPEECSQEAYDLIEACCRAEGAHRPTAAEVVTALESLPEANEPA